MMDPRDRSPVFRSNRARVIAGLFSLALAPACSSSAEGTSGTSAEGGGHPSTSSNSNSGSTSSGGGNGGGASTSSGATTSGTGGGGGFDPEAGWTNFTPSADTHKIYVSSSTGDDSHDGMSAATAVKTVAAGVKLVRDGHPDWLLLKRGDVWHEAIGSWSKSGLSEQEPALVSYYGDMSQARPALETGSTTALQLNDKSTVNHVAFVGLHFYADARDPSSPTFSATAGLNPGVFIVSTTDGLLLEDMRISFYANNLVVQGDDTHPIQNVKIRRSVIIDAWSSGNSEGVYLETIKNLLVEENVIDHNGWNEQASGGFKTIFNHNVYIQADCTNVTFQRNVSTRASSHGVQVRPGGQAIDNLLVQNALGMSFGLTLGGHAPTPGGVTGEVSGNVILESNDIKLPTLPRGIGLQLGNIQSASVHDNIVAHNASGVPSDGNGIQLTEGTGVGFHNLTLKNDIVYDWQGPSFTTSYYDSGTKMSYPTAYENVTLSNEAIQVVGALAVYQYFDNTVISGLHFTANTYDSAAAAGSWFFLKSGTQSLTQWAQATGDTSKAAKITYKDPSRSLGTYSQSLGKAATFDGYMNEARKQARGDYRYEYTTEAALAYIRDGFTVMP